MPFTQQQAIALLTLLNGGKLPSELDELSNSDLNTDNNYLVLNNGSNDAKKIKVSLLRGYKGTYDASTNTPDLSSIVGLDGDMYVVSVAGSSDLGAGVVNLLEDDIIIYLNNKYLKTNGIVTGSLDLQGVYDNSSPKTITVADSNDGTLTVKDSDTNNNRDEILQVQDTSGNILFYVQRDKVYIKDKLGIGTENPNSKLHLIKSKNSANDEIGTFIDVEQASSATGSNYNYAQIVRSLFSGSGTIGDVWGAQFIARANGSGNVNQLVGSYSLADLEGTADATTVISNYSLSEIKGTGSSTLDDVLGVWAKLEIDNANKNITDAYASYSNIDIKSGTVSNLILQMLDYDFSSADQSNVSVENLYYIKAKDDNIPNVTENAYFIFSESTLNSYLEGNLGIGVEDPSEKLEVDGNTLIRGGLTLNKPNPQASFIGTNREYFLQVVDIDNRFRIYDNTGSSERITLLDTGEVGIGVTDPSEKLEVDGNALVEGNIYERFVVTEINPDPNNNDEFDLSDEHRVLRFSKSASGTLVIPTGLSNKVWEIFVATGDPTVNLTIEANTSVILSYIKNGRVFNDPEIISSDYSAKLIRTGDNIYTLIRY